MIVIKKKVSLDFLGEEYKDAYLVFQSIPIRDIDELTASVKKAEEENTSGKFILETLKKYFITGVFPDMDVLTPDDLDGLDQQSVIKAFAIFTGQLDADPKVLTPSQNISTTDTTTTTVEQS